MRIKSTIKYLLWHIIHFFVRFIPRNRKIWIFGSRNETFFGNSKWLFLHLHNSNKTNIRKIWISRTKKTIKMLKAKGFEAYHLKSLKGCYYAMRGGIYLFNVNTNYDINYFFSNGAKKINLWHGVGGKKIGFDSDLKSDFFYKLYYGNLRQKIHYHFFSPWEYEKYDIMISTSEMTKKCMETAFGKRVKKVIATGYPCNDTLLKDIKSPFFDEDEKLMKRLKTNQKKIIVYMPTFRDVEVRKSKSTSIPIDWKKLNSFLEKNNSVFVMKLHPVEKSTLQVPSSCKNILAPNNLNDVYPALKYADVLVTDYSTVCYNFLLCSKPIIFFWHDIEKYRAENRSLYESFENLLIGPRVKTFDALLDVLDKCINDKNFIKENLKIINKCRNIANKYIDGNSSERIYKKIVNKSVKK